MARSRIVEAGEEQLGGCESRRSILNSMRMATEATDVAGVPPLRPFLLLLLEVLQLCRCHAERSAPSRGPRPRSRRLAKTEVRVASAGVVNRPPRLVLPLLLHHGDLAGRCALARCLGGSLCAQNPHPSWVRLRFGQSRGASFRWETMSPEREHALHVDRRRCFLSDHCRPGSRVRYCSRLRGESGRRRRARLILLLRRRCLFSLTTTEFRPSPAEGVLVLSMFSGVQSRRCSARQMMRATGLRRRKARCSAGSWSTTASFV